VDQELFPYCVQPNFKLVDNNKKLVEDGYEIVKHDKFTLDTQVHPDPVPNLHLNTLNLTLALALALCLTLTLSM